MMILNSSDKQKNTQTQTETQTQLLSVFFLTNIKLDSLRTHLEANVTYAKLKEQGKIKI